MAKSRPGWQEPDVGQLHPIQQSILHEARRTNTWVPFNQMMPSLAKLDSGWQTSLAFAEVTLLIQQIIEDGGPRKLRNVVQAFGEGTGRGFKELDVTSVDQLWDRFLVRLQTTALDPVPGYKFIPRSVAEDPDVAEPEPIAGRAARKFTRLGDLLRKEGRWAAAVTEYVKAEGELGYRPASLSLKVAEAMMIGGDYRRAESELRALLVRDPDRATAHWLLGKIALFRSDPAEAIERYEKAFSIAPFHETVIDGLVQASTRLGDEDRTTKYTNAMEIWNATK